MKLLDQAFEYFNSKAIPFVDGASRCLRSPELLLAYLLGGIFLQLKELREASSFGTNYFNIVPFELGTVPIRILEKEPNGLVRKVSFWIDSASGGPTPTIRISRSGSSTAGGGIRVNAGQVNELGEVPPGTELWAAASTTIVGYIIERA